MYNIICICICILYACMYVLFNVQVYVHVDVVVIVVVDIDVHTTHSTRDGYVTVVWQYCGRHLPPKAMGDRFTIFWGKSAMRTRWMAGTPPHKSRICRGPTTTRKQVGIGDICHRQIYSRKPISIRCNTIDNGCT